MITGHGGRGSGTSKGTYVVPKGVTIYFFTNDSTVLYSGASDALMDQLCRRHTKVNLVRSHAVDIKTEFQTVPNYVCYGTDDFRDASGVWQVGLRRTHGPILPIPDGTEKRLSEIIGGSGGGGVIGSNIYWLCCRASPDNSNNIDDDSDIVTGRLSRRLGRYKIGATEIGSDTGLKPSEVARTGHWR